VKVGELYRFGGYLCPQKFYDKIVVYLGEDPIHRSDGVTVINHKIAIQGEPHTRIIDRTCLKWMIKL
jgi:hypothetical protein